MKIIDGTQYTDEVRELITEYTNFLGRDLSFQSIDEELENLNAKYAPPYGRLLCAKNDDGRIVGCIAYHKHSNERCEMKRLYVREEYRKLHTGSYLIEEALKLAAEDGYKEMVLDTIKPLKSAVHLYKKYGFEETEPYYDNPMEDVVYMKKLL